MYLVSEKKVKTLLKFGDIPLITNNNFLYHFSIIFLTTLSSPKVVNMGKMVGDNHSL